MINFEALRKAKERMEDSKDGQLGRCGNWKIALGGYDMGYEVYYKNYPVMRVNYESNEYEFYNCDYSDVMFTPDTVPQIKKALDITPRFDNAGDIDDSGDYIDRFGQYVNGVEANVSESGRSKRVKFKKIVKKADEKPNPDFKPLDKVTWEIGRTPDGKRQNESDSDNSASDHPRIYVSTYERYNNGSLEGKWVDLTGYNTYGDFLDDMYDTFADGDDPEFMVQDYENFPGAWYHEGGLPTEEEFNKINDYYMMDDDRKAAYEAYVNYTDDDDIEHFEEAYQGHFNSASDFAYDLVDSIGWDGVGQDNLDMYFDYDAFGRDLMMDYHMGDEDNEDAEGNPEDPDHYYDNDGYDMGEYKSDEQVAYDFIDDLGGVNQLGKDTVQNYFDYDSFGRDLLINDYFEEDGYVFSR